MTPEEMDQLDREMAELMGWRKEYREGLWTMTECYAGKGNVWIDSRNKACARVDDEHDADYIALPLWHPTRDIAQALQVLTIIVNKHLFAFSIYGTPPHSSIQRGIRVLLKKSVYPPDRNDLSAYIGQAVSLELAICIVARQAIKQEKETKND